MAKRASMPSSALPPAGPDALPERAVLAEPPGAGDRWGALGRKPARLAPTGPTSATVRPGITGVAAAAGGRRALVGLMKT